MVELLTEPTTDESPAERRKPSKPATAFSITNAR